MKKYSVFFLFGFVIFTNIFASDQAAYQRLMRGEKNLTGADLRDVEIKDIDFDGVDFSNADLSGAKFNNVILTKAIFCKTNLQRACFCDVVLKDSQILAETNLAKATFKNVGFDESTVKETSFQDAIFEDSHFLLSDIQKTSMELVLADKLFFVDSTLADISFSNSKNVSGKGTTLSNLLISNTTKIGENLDFSFATLTKCRFLGTGRHKQLLSMSKFCRTAINGSFFCNIHFDQCKGLQESQKGAGSVFCKINSTDKNDLKFLKEKRKAKVNGYYDDYDTWGDKKSEREFFEKLLLGGTSKLASLGISVLVASVL